MIVICWLYKGFYEFFISEMNNLDTNKFCSSLSFEFKERDTATHLT